MKKALKSTVSFVLAFVMVFSMLTVIPSELFHSTYVHAAEAISELAGADPEIYENDDFTYILTDEFTKVRIMSCKLEDDEIVIPDTIDGKKVTSIGPRAFYGSSITSVIFGKNIETICEYAFSDCASLQSVDFAESKLKTIETCAFSMNTLTELVFPDTIESIGYGAFSPYYNGDYSYNAYRESVLEKVTFGQKLKTIGDYAFYLNYNLSEINFEGNQLKSIGLYAFSSNNALTNLEIRGDNTIIGRSAFSNCENLENVRLYGIEKLSEEYAFWYCKKLKSFTADDSLKEIGNYSFQYDDALETAAIGSGVTSIGIGAFYDCNSLSSIAIPDGVDSVPDDAFGGCGSLETLSIGSGVNNISKLAFADTHSLNNITVSADNETFKCVDNVVYSKDGKTIVLFKKSLTGEYTIPDGIETIAPYAFQNCSLTKVVIPGSVKNISEYAFQNCPNLAEVVFEGSETVEKIIGDYAFSNCAVLASVDFGNAVKTIGKCAFSMSSFTELVFPDSVEVIGYGAFSPYKDGCFTYYGYRESNLQKVTFGQNLKTIGEYAFYLNYKLAEATFNGNQITNINAYAFESCNALTELKISGNNAVIDYHAFYSCENLENVSLIGVEQFSSEYTFSYCQKLKSFTADDSLKTIGNYSFEYDNLLETANIGSGVTSIGISAFDGCSSLKALAIPDGVTSIPDYAFGECASLETVSVGSGVVLISSTAFLNNTSLNAINVSEDNSVYSSADGVLYNKEKTEIILSPKNKEGKITIPDTVITIKDYAFQNSPNLTSVVIGKNVETIGNYAFYGCSKLQSVVIADSDDTEKTIGDYAFSDCAALTSFDFGNAVKSIGSCAFSMSSITELVFPDSLEDIGYGAFSPCEEGYENTYYRYRESNLQKVTFGQNLKTIGEYAFYQNNKLAEVNFTGNLITNINSYAFKSCGALTELEISGNNAVFGDEAFDNCENLESIKLHGVENLNDSYVFAKCNKLKSFTADDSLKTIGEHSFEDDNLLETAVIGSGVTSLGSSAFKGCNSLRSIAIPDGVDYIPDYAFQNCGSLETLSIGSGVNHYSKLAFVNAGALRNITISSDNETYNCVDNVVYSEDGKTIVLFKKGLTGEYTIPDGVETIAPYAFQNCQLSKIVIPESVRNISEYAFQNSPNLAEVVFEDSDTADKIIGDYAFSNCAVLTSVDFGNAVKTIGNCAFSMTSITELVFSDSVEAIGYGAFSPYIDGHFSYYEYRESKLEKVTFGKKLKTIGGYAFYCNYRLAKVNFTGTQLTSVDSYAFTYCDSLTELKITGENAVIASNAFNNCDNLESVVISGNNVTLGEDSFYYCPKIKTVSLSGVTSIGDEAFLSNNSLEKVVMSNDVTSIGDYAFGAASALKEVVLSKSLETIGSNAFTGYTDLTVYCYEDTYAHEYALTLDDVEIKFILDDYFVTNLRTVNLASKSVTFAWGKPKGYENIDHYIISKNGAKYDETNSLSFTDTGLTPGETYIFGVKAVDTDGIISEEKTLEIITACTSVERIILPNKDIAVGGLFKIKLTAIMENNLSRYGATAKFTYGLEGESQTDACAATLMPDGVTYVGYWDITDVRSGDYMLRFTLTDKDGGQSFKETQVIVDRTHPAAIDELTVTPLETTIDLAWQISKEYETRIYRVYRRADYEDEFDLISEIRDRNATTYSDKNVEKGVTYDYYVVGTDPFGQESLTYEIVSAGIIDDSIPPEFTSMYPTSNSFIYGSKWFTVNATDNVGVTKIELYYAQDSNVLNENWTILASHNGSVFDDYVDTTVIPDGEVFVKAKIYDGNGNFVYSPAYRYYSDNTGPAKVQNVTCVQAIGTIVTLSWDEVADNDLSYYVVEVKNSDDSSDDTYEWAAQTSNTNGVNIKNLVPETEYTYRVVGYDKFNNRGVESDPITVTTAADTTAPVISQISPEPGYYSDSIPLYFYATDDYKVTYLTIQTSEDKFEWSNAAVLAAPNPLSGAGFYYDLSLENFEEGLIFVRGIAEDSYENVTPQSEATVYEYIVDKTAPEAPLGISAASAAPEETGICYVNVSWNAVLDDDSFSYYNVFRSDEQNGDYTLVKGNLTTVNTYDNKVEYGKTYYYKIEAVDKAGNVSEMSDAVSCRVKDDEEPPVIHSVSPENGSYIGEKSSVISIAASDNSRLDTLRVEYKTNALFSDFTTIREVTGNAKTNCEINVTLPVAELSNGTEITLRITAADSSGNEAEEKIVTYTVDKEAAEIKDVTLSKTEDNVYTASWTTEAEDADYFYIYKKTANDSEYTLYDSVMAKAGKTSYTFTDDEITLSDISVGYKIESYDRVGNTASANTGMLGVSGQIKPKAFIDCQPTMVFGSEYLFDATATTDDGGITSYEFIFGDETDPVVNAEGKITHVYNEKGDYTLVLTVTDTDGNTDTIRKQITVTGRELVNKVYVTVKDNSGSVMPNTDVYADLGETTQQHAYTNSFGLATFELPVGTHIISSYKNSDYLPIKRSIAVTGNDIQLTLILINEPIVTGEFEIHKMTFDEIVAAGIDINAAENRNVIKIDVTLEYEQMPIKTQIFWNGVHTIADPVYVRSSSGKTHKLTPCVIGGANEVSGEESGYGIGSAGSYGGLYNPTVVYIDVPVDFSYLKEFFDVKLHILNHASEDFSLLNNRVTLNVPEGLTVVESNNSSSKETVLVDEIKGQTQKTISWVLRGDEPGTYDISADYLGMLSYFNEPVTAKFVADEPITVQDATSINVEIEASETSYGGTVFYNTIIENTGDFALESFEWVPLIESYVDEFVDANGNKTEMTEQRTILRPGEKFIYHYFTKLNRMYRYIGDTIEEMNNNGANVTVTTHPVSYFTPLYFNKFPEEAGFYTFTVSDKYDNPIAGAKIKLTDDFEFITDAAGQVRLTPEQRQDILTDHILITKDSYYDYDEYFGGVKLGSEMEITLYKLDDFVVEDVLLNGQSAVSGTRRIATNDTDDNGNPKDVVFMAKIYGDVDKYDVYQGDNAIPAVRYEAKADKHLFMVVCSAADFEIDEPVEFRAVSKDGNKKATVKLLTRIIEADLNPNIKLPEDEFKITVNSGEYSWLNKFTFNFKLTDNMQLSFQYDTCNDKLIVGLNIDAITWKEVSTKAQGNSSANNFGTVQKYNNYQGYSMYKEIAENIRNEYAKAPKLNEIKNFAPGKVSISVKGALEFKIQDDGSPKLTNSTLNIGASFSIGYDTNFVIGPVPVSAGISIISTAGVETKFASKIENNLPMIYLSDADLKLGSRIELKIGIGWSCLSAGVYGSVGASMDIVLASETLPPGLKQLKLNGEFGLYVKFIFFDFKYPLISGEYTVFKREVNEDYQEAVGKAYNPDFYSVNNDILSCNPYWASPIATGTGTTNLLDNAYAGTPAQIAVCGDKAVMVYQGVDSSADSVANALALYYSVYSPETMKWSIPKKLDSNRQADFDFNLVSNGDKAYVLYTQANSELPEDIGIYDVTKNLDVYSAEFNSSTETFNTFDRLTSDESYDTIPVIKTIGGSPTAVWVSNSEGSPFLSEGTNSIKLSKLENGDWSAPQTVAVTENPIINCDVVASDRTPVVVYTTDTDDDFVTTDDRILTALNTSSNESQTIAQGVNSSVEVGKLMGNDVVMWYENDVMKQYNAKTSAIISIEGIPSSAAKEFKLASDENGNNSLVFVFENKLYAKYYNSETGEWSDMIEIASSENNIDNISAEYVNGKLNVTYYDTRITDAENMTTESALKTVVAANTPKPEIIEASADYENLVPGEETELAVTVMNNSSEPTGNLTFTVTNYDGAVLGSYTTENVSLGAGEIQDFVVPFTAPDDIVNRDITVTVTDSSKTGVSSMNVKLAVVDYSVYASQFYENDKEYIKVYVCNNTNYTSTATLEVFDRYTGEVFCSTNISKVEKDYPVSKTIEIDESFIDKNGYISVRIVTKAEDKYEEDNADMFQYIPKEAFDTPNLLIGDANLDGEVDINDATAISKHLVNLIRLEGKALAVADVNCDAEIDINDVTCIQKYLAGYSEYGNCGERLSARA